MKQQSLPDPTMGATSRALPDPKAEAAMSAARTAALLGVSKAYVYLLIKSGEIPSLRVGNRIVVPTAALLAKYPALVPAAA